MTSERKIPISVKSFAAPQRQAFWVFGNHMLDQKPNCVTTGIAHPSYVGRHPLRQGYGTVVLTPGQTNVFKSEDTEFSPEGCKNCSAKEVCSGVLHRSLDRSPIGHTNVAYLGQIQLMSPHELRAKSVWAIEARNPHEVIQEIPTHDYSEYVVDQLMIQDRDDRVACIHVNPKIKGSRRILGTEVVAEGGTLVSLSTTSISSTQLTVPEPSERPDGRQMMVRGCEFCPISRGFVNPKNGTFTQCSSAVLQENGEHIATISDRVL